MTEETMMGDWDSDFSGDNANKSGGDLPPINYMKFDKEGKYYVRLVGKYVKFLRHWTPFDSVNRQKVITHPTYKSDDPAWQAGFRPRLMYAINVIDRADGKLKILEKGNSIFKVFGAYKTENDINPAGKSGPDFVIEVVWPGGNKRAAKYTVTAKAKPSPLTDEELAMAKAEAVNLTNLYKSTPLDKIKELWEKVPADKKIPPTDDNKPSSASAPAEDKTPVETEAAPTNDVLDGGASEAKSEDDGADLF